MMLVAGREPSGRARESFGNEDERGPGWQRRDGLQDATARTRLPDSRLGPQPPPRPPATRAAAALPLGHARAAHAQASAPRPMRAGAGLGAAETWQGLVQHPAQVPGAARLG